MRVVIAYNGLSFTVPRPQTGKPEYAPRLLASLRDLEGEAPRDQVLGRMYAAMEDGFHPADRELLYGGAVPRWVSEAEHMLDGLLEEGYVEERGPNLRLTRRGVDYLEGHAESL